MDWLVGTRNGLLDASGRRLLDGREITSLAAVTDGWWVLADGDEVLRVRGTDVEPVVSVEGETGRCLLPIGDAALVGTANARLASVRAGTSELLSAFDAAEGRDGWYTPWGGPPDTRSLAAGPDGAVFANVHVGGILRSDDPREVWTPTIDIDADVHQVVADPTVAGHVVAATARGLAESHDGGGSWAFSAEGLHAPYSRAVALHGDALFLSASTGPRGGRAAVYRRGPGAEVFERCEVGLPEWVDGNVDSHCLAAAEGGVVFGTEDGRVFASADGGRSWDPVATGLGRVTCAGVGVLGQGAT
ncbi:MAG: WD40/YVTN/BNR-like repeat-containing protein [Actinomycetota bacterium]